MYKLVKVPSDIPTFDVVMTDVVVGRTVHVAQATWDTKIGAYEYSAKFRRSSVEGCIRRIVVQNSYTTISRIK